MKANNISGLALKTTEGLGIPYGKPKTGKVRDTYEIDENHILIVTTDRISVFDRVLPTPIPGKGIVLNQISNILMDQFKYIVPNHLVAVDFADFPSALEPWRNILEYRSVIAKKLSMIDFEDIVRGNIGGSVWDMYLAGLPVGGYELPKGLKLWQKLETPLHTPSTKAKDGESDQNIPREEMQRVLGNDNLFKTIDESSVKLFIALRDYAAMRGVTVLDTKMEFGLDGNQRLVLGDEFGTPDSSRYCLTENYNIAFAAGKNPDSMDKQPTRDYIKGREKQSEFNLKDKNPKLPELPDDLVLETIERYMKAYSSMGCYNGGDVLVDIFRRAKQLVK